MSSPLRRLAIAVLLSASICAAPTASECRAEPKDAAAHRAQLLDGVREIHKPGIPGPIALIGEDAFTLAAATFRGGVRHAVVAAATPGDGRIVAFGHSGYLTATGDGAKDTPRLVTNAIHWAAGGKPKPLVGVVDPGAIAGLLQSAEISARPLDRRHWADALAEIDVLVITHPTLDGAANVEPLRDFVRGGGGLVTAGLAWGWMQLNPSSSLRRDHVLNRALAPLGLAFTDGYADKILPVAETPPPGTCHALAALGLLGRRPRDRELTKQQRVQQSVQLSAVLGNAYRWIPAEESTFRGAVRKAVGAVRGKMVPTKAKPLRAEHVLGRLSYVVAHLDAQDAPPEHVRAAPSADEFPGAVPRAAIRRVPGILIDLTVPGWASTGLYAPPGGVVTLRTSTPEALPGLRVRIGCHSDQLWDKPAWWRHPQISSSFPFVLEAAESAAGPENAGEDPGPSLRIASAHGGLIYVEVPENTDASLLVLDAAGVLRAPYYELGKTDAVLWKTIRRYPAPWAELANSKITLTVPSRAVRDLEDPGPLMEFWSEVLDLYPELGRRPLTRRPQRIVADRQISVGWMHAGYPIMIHLDSVGQLVSLAALRDAPRETTGAWGVWHELGHNHQHRDWTFAGTTEVTCNLFSLFVDERVRDLAPPGHPWPKGKREKAAAYIRDGSDFATWKRSPGIALWMYILLVEEFGWKAFQQTFADYAALPDGERPRTDAQKRDQWLVRFSRTVGRDLGPYFQAWGVPTSKVARDEVRELKPWMPALVKDALAARKRK